MHKKLLLVVEQRGAKQVVIYDKLLFFSRYERSRNKNSRLLLYKSLRIMIVFVSLGGTMVAAIDMLIERGVTSKQIKVVSSSKPPYASVT